MQDFNFTLSNPVNAGFGGSGYGSNLDVYVSDNGGTFSFGSTNYSVSDDWTNVTLTVNRSGGSDGAAVISLGTYDGAARSGTDYTATNGLLQWLAGDSSARRFSIPIAYKGVGVNVDFNAYLCVQSADSGSALAGGPTSVIIARRAHPVAPAFVAPVIGLGTPVVTFQVNATQGGVFDVQILDSTTNSTNFSWKTVYTITNTFGTINIPNDTSLEVKGRWYRLHAR